LVSRKMVTREAVEKILWVLRFRDHGADSSRTGEVREMLLPRALGQKP
jgi:hypothetical protein